MFILDTLIVSVSVWLVNSVWIMSELWHCLILLVVLEVFWFYDTLIIFVDNNNNNNSVCIFCVLSLVKPTKMSGNCPEFYFKKIWSWNFIFCFCEPCAIDFEKKLKCHRWECVGVWCRCMDGSSTCMRCRRCSAPWSGATLLIGTMYSYDVFAASPCCAARLQCKQCHQAVFDHNSTAGQQVAPPLKYYSDYSRRVKCQRCGVEDFHFVKPLDEMYDVSGLRSASQRHQQQQGSNGLPRIWSNASLPVWLLGGHVTGKSEKVREFQSGQEKATWKTRKSREI